MLNKFNAGGVPAVNVVPGIMAPYEPSPVAACKILFVEVIDDEPERITCVLVKLAKPAMIEVSQRVVDKVLAITPGPGVPWLVLNASALIVTAPEAAVVGSKYIGK